MLTSLKPIRTEADYQDALATINRLMDSEPGSPDFDTLEILATLVSAYEDTHFPIDRPSPTDAIHFRMDQQGLTPEDLAPAIGTPDEIREILSGTRALTLETIRAFHKHLHIPAEILLETDD